MPREKPQSSLTLETGKKPPQDRRVALVTTHIDVHCNPMRLTSNDINRSLRSSIRAKRLQSSDLRRVRKSVHASQTNLGKVILRHAENMVERNSPESLGSSLRNILVFIKTEETEP